MKSTHKQIVDRDDYFDIEQINNKTFDEIATIVSSLRNKYKNVSHTIRVEPYGYDGGLDFFVRVFRQENDQEYNKRIKKEQAERDRKNKVELDKETRERKEYERLAKKFGGQNDKN